MRFNRITVDPEVCSGKPCINRVLENVKEENLLNSITVVDNARIRRTHLPID